MMLGIVAGLVLTTYERTVAPFALLVAFIVGFRLRTGAAMLMATGGSSCIGLVILILAGAPN